MPNKNEIERRKQIKKELRENAKLQFEQNLPMPRKKFLELFDYLDEQLANKECEDTLKLTAQFLIENSIEDHDKTMDWLKENGGYCDCEVLSNIEEMFDEDAIL